MEAKKQLEPREAGRGQEQFPLEPLEGDGLANTLISILASCNFYCFKPVCGNTL